MLIIHYDFSRLEFKTDIPTTVFYSATDIPREDMDKWHNIFTGRFDMVEYDGDHFFITDHMQEMADIIIDKMTLKDGDGR